MAEAIGIVTGLIGACDVILRAAKTIADFIAEVKEMPTALEHLDLEIGSLLAISAALREFLRSSKIKRTGFEEKAPITSALNKCQLYMVELEKTFQSKRKKSSLRLAFSDKARIEKEIEKVRNFTDLFHFALSINGWSFFTESLEETKLSLKENVASLNNVTSILQTIPSMSAEVDEIKNHILTMQSILHILASDQTSTHNEHSSTNAKLKEIDERLKNMEDEKNKKEEELEWISSQDFWEKHKDVSSARQNGTSEAILEATEFKDWRQRTSTATLWCQGIPGSGKTVTFSLMVDYLVSTCKQTNCLLAALYLDYKNTDFQNMDVVFAGVLRQLCEQSKSNPHVMDIVLSFYRINRANKAKTPALDLTLSVIKKIGQLQEQVFLCFDALDEIPSASRQNLLKVLKDLCQDSNIKVLITSREHIILTPTPVELIKLRIVATESDLRKYLVAKLDETNSDCIQSRAAASMPLREKIITAIISRARGMFLLAELQIKQLEDALTVREINTLLQFLPHEINDQYASYIERIKANRHGNLGMDALWWIHGSSRPLTELELLEALSVQEGDTDLEQSGMVSIETIMNLTGGLLTLETESRVVRLVHETLQEFLNSYDKEATIHRHHHQIITIVTYLNFHSFDRSLVRDEWLTIGALKRSHKFLSYAFNNWTYHLDFSQLSDLQVGLELCKRIASSSVLVELIRSFRRLPFQFDRPRGFGALHVAVLWKSEALVNALLLPRLGDSTISIDDRSQTGLTALHVAAMNNSLQIAQTLIARDVTLTSTAWPVDEAKRSPLHVAAMCGSYDVLDYLLEYLQNLPKAVTNSQLEHKDAQGMIPLHAALIGGQHSCALRLLQLGSNIEAVTNNGNTPLHYAVQYTPSIVKLLLQQGASTQSKSKNGRTALHWACEIKNSDSISILLNHGSDPNVADNFGDFPLNIITQATIENFYSTRLLVEKGAILDAVGGSGTNALHNSIANAHFQIAAYLCSQGARVDIADSEGQIPLVLAAAHYDCPESLWKVLGDPNQHDEHGNTILHVEAWNQKSRVVENLIQKYGAFVDSRNKLGETPLHAALRNYKQHRRSTLGQRSDVVSLLLLYKADANATSLEGIHPIHLALANQSEILLKILKSNGSHTPSTDPSGRGFLHQAILETPVTLFKLLLDSKVETDYLWRQSFPFDFAALSLMHMCIAEFMKANTTHGVTFSVQVHTYLEVFEKANPDTMELIHSRYFKIQNACLNLLLLWKSGLDLLNPQHIFSQPSLFQFLQQIISAAENLKTIHILGRQALKKLSKGLVNNTNNQQEDPSTSDENDEIASGNEEWDDSPPIYELQKEYTSLQTSRPRFNTEGLRSDHGINTFTKKPLRRRVSIRRMSSIPEKPGRKIVADAQARHAELYHARNAR